LARLLLYGHHYNISAGFGIGLAKLGDVNLLFVSLDGDAKNSTYAQEFMAAHPDRYFKYFIAGQNMSALVSDCQVASKSCLFRLLPRS
jgi:transketolase C-terminal domain/subunit